MRLRCRAGGNPRNRYRVCIYVCMYSDVSIYVIQYKGTHVHIYIYSRIRMHVRVYTTYACVPIYILVHTYRYG
jgi:hypothetical protein